MSRDRAVVELPQAPSADDLKAAASHGMTYLAWCSAGRPLSTAPKPKRKPSLANLTRPWAPYCSKWEKAYANHLEMRRLAGANVVGPIVEAWEYEPEKLEIGVGAVYTPDFRVRCRLGTQRWIEWREVKGYRREASIVRIKAAALRYPNDVFVLVTRANGEWLHQTIGAKP